MHSGIPDALLLSLLICGTLNTYLNLLREKKKHLTIKLMTHKLIKYSITIKEKSQCTQQHVLS